MFHDSFDRIQSDGVHMLFHRNVSHFTILTYINTAEWWCSQTRCTVSHYSSVVNFWQFSIASWQNFPALTGTHGAVKISFTTQSSTCLCANQKNPENNVSLYGSLALWQMPPFVLENIGRPGPTGFYMVNYVIPFVSWNIEADYCNFRREIWLLVIFWRHSATCSLAWASTQHFLFSNRVYQM